MLSIFSKNVYFLYSYSTRLQPEYLRKSSAILWTPAGECDLVSIYQQLNDPDWHLAEKKGPDQVKKTHKINQTNKQNKNQSFLFFKNVKWTKILTPSI